MKLALVYDQNDTLCLTRRFEFGDTMYRYTSTWYFEEETTLAEIESKIAENNIPGKLALVINNVPIDVRWLKQTGEIRAVVDFKLIDIIRNNMNITTKPIPVHKEVFEVCNGYYNILTTNNSMLIVPIEGSVIFELNLCMHSQKIYPMPGKK